MANSRRRRWSRGCPRVLIPVPGTDRFAGAMEPIASPISSRASPQHRARQVASWARSAGLALAATLLTGCMAYGPGPLQPGQTRQDVVARMGQPTAERPRPEGGTRLEFARGPMGTSTFMIDVDAAGRIETIQQVLDEKNFMTLKPGMTRDEVLYRIGTLSDRMRIARQNIDVWSYRYFVNFCQWFQVSMDLTTGRLRETGYAPDPMCDAGGDDPQVSIP